ncbi:amino acid ABC transporter ATP-binding protein [Fusibacter ferrireducens]|uniref:Amino acid ABC transporter ATP-binding protein n=1 Tax=Fusibacter ferrireducens TaxID=2785058 RepID=A0ABR9ZR63_9FIRM|nr:amino acid ABC transporter ATP-binding protein [Fusibacter ferrireducens]MBF4692939.1 amino acid ABC transporter ATP-binding protein [Fusibacter ferrireducens]
MNLELKHLTKKYQDKTVLDDITLKLENIQILALLGASGSGKSTLLRLIAGLEPFQGGDIIVNNNAMRTSPLDQFRKNVGFVFQDHNLFSHLSIMENILLVLEKVHKRKRADVIKPVSELLERFGLIEHAHKLPHQISGGQSQRASIVRALAIQPELILLDEPTSSLDPVLTYEVLSAIKQLAEDQKDFIIVTHEIGFAKSVADYIVFMENGKIVEHGYRSILDQPQSAELKRFLDKVLTFIPT